MKIEVMAACAAYKDALWPWKSAVSSSWPIPKPRNFQKKMLDLYVDFEEAVTRPSWYKSKISRIQSARKLSTEAMESYRRLLLALNENIISPTTPFRFTEADVWCDDIATLVAGYGRRTITPTEAFSSSVTRVYPEKMKGLTDYYQSGERLRKCRPFSRMQENLVNDCVSYYGEITPLLRKAVGLTNLATAIMSGDADYIFYSDTEKNSITEAIVDLFENNINFEEPDASAYSAATALINRLTNIDFGSVLDYERRTPFYSWYRYAYDALLRMEGIKPFAFGDNEIIAAVNKRFG